MKTTAIILAGALFLYGAGAMAIAAPEPLGPYRLIGFGCGAAKETLLAREEDEFPVECEAIEPLNMTVID